MKISVTKAAEEWGVSRTTIYQKVNDGELSRTSDKKIDTSEMLRVFGEPVSKKRTEQSVNTIDNTHSNSQSVQDCSDLKHKLELEKANASLHDFTQIRLLEFKKSESNVEQKYEPAEVPVSAHISSTGKKKRWWKI